MLKAQELRIGNYVEEFLPVKLWTKIEVNYQDLKFVYFEDTNSFYRPIPITEEWLLKLGFVYNGWNYDYDRYTFHAQKRVNDAFVNTEFSIKSGEHSVILSYSIKYIHQLQNACFALTGRELTLNQTA